MSVLAVAHRAGNSLPGLRAAQALRVPVVEGDLHLRAGVLELHHLTRLGPLPWRLDQRRHAVWRLVPAAAPQLRLDELVEAAAGTALLLDLKADDVGAAAVAALRHRPPATPLLVCGNSTAVDAFAGLPWARQLLSAGDPGELARVQSRLGAGPPVHGVSVHRRMLSPQVVRELRRQVAVVLAWPVNDGVALRQVLGLGVDGVVSDDPRVLRAVVALST
jgi:glycerophosphoryl diester phosphodiesterase